MILTIDTTQPLTPADRAVLTALLDQHGDTTHHGPPQLVPPTNGHTPGVASFMEKVQQAAAKPRGAMSEARLPVTQQAGVRTSESVADSDDHEDAADAARAADAYQEYIDSGRKSRPLADLADELD